MAENVTERMWREQRPMALKDPPELETEEQYIRRLLGGGDSVLADHQYSQTNNSNTTSQIQTEKQQPEKDQSYGPGTPPSHVGDCV